MKSKLLFLVAALSLGCRPEHARVADSASATTNDGRPSATAVAQQGGVCPTPAGGLRLGVDTVAGMPANLSIAALRKLCASARVDTLVVSKPAQSWEAVGDSLRFPHGGLIPRQLGQIRAGDSVGFMSIDYGDDSYGAAVTLCRVPSLAFFFDTLPAPADTTLQPLAGISVADTSSYRRVLVQADTLVRYDARHLCARVAGRSTR